MSSSFMSKVKKVVGDTAGTAKARNPLFERIAKMSERIKSQAPAGDLSSRLRRRVDQLQQQTSAPPKTEMQGKKNLRSMMQAVKRAKMG